MPPMSAFTGQLDEPGRHPPGSTALPISVENALPGADVLLRGETAPRPARWRWRCLSLRWVRLVGVILCLSLWTATAQMYQGSRLYAFLGDLYQPAPLQYALSGPSKALKAWRQAGRPPPLKRKVHLLIPLNEASVDYKACWVLASALVHGYSPVLLNWDLKNNIPVNARHVAKLNAVHHYFKKAHKKVSRGDVVMMTDGFDVVLQLPPEHVLKRYFEINPVQGKERVVTAADKACHPNIHFEEEVCKSAPMSPLPRTSYGEETGEFRDPFNRPRWSNTGMVVGTVDKMQELYTAISKDPGHAKWTSDQIPFNRFLAAGNITVDYESRLAWTGGADLDNFVTVGVRQPIDGISSAIPYAMMPKLGLQSTTGNVPVAIHFNMGHTPGKHGPHWTDALDKDDAMQWVLSELWWSKGERRFRKIARRELSARRIYLGPEDKKGRHFEQICSGKRDI